MRLLTRADFDGLACAVLLTDHQVVDSYAFVHPRTIQHGKIAVGPNDVLANVPYAPGCGLWFDHHASEQERLGGAMPVFDGASREAPSAAQVIWDHYGGAAVFGKAFNPMLKAVNKTDSADLRLDEVLFADGWVLLYFIIDPRTGLDEYKGFRRDRHHFMLKLIEACRTMTIDEILRLPDVEERVWLYHAEQKRHKEMLRRCTQTDHNVIIVNLLNPETVYAGNRFLAFAKNPAQNIELRISRGESSDEVVFNCGHSIFNRTSRTDVGRLMLKYGGGGHRTVGSCSVPFAQWQKTAPQILARLIKDG